MGYQELANGIVLQAVKDYRRALRAFAKNPESQSALRSIRSLEAFFRSEWYRCLTKVDGKRLMRMLREEVDA